MNPRIKEIAEESGFCFWGDEDWKPHGAIIDWSADYDDEFQKYTELLIKECIKVNIDKYKNSDYMSYNIVVSLSNNIKEHFGIE